MVITILEARVASEKAIQLEEAYKQAVERLDTGIVQTYLLRSKKDSNLWQIATIWENQESLDAMRRSGETPRGVVIFRAAEAEASLQVFDLVAQGVALNYIRE